MDLESRCHYTVAADGLAAKSIIIYDWTLHLWMQKASRRVWQQGCSPFPVCMSEQVRFHGRAASVCFTSVQRWDTVRDAGASVNSSLSWRRRTRASPDSLNPGGAPMCRLLIRRVTLLDVGACDPPARRASPRKECARIRRNVLLESTTRRKETKKYVLMDSEDECVPPCLSPFGLRILLSLWPLNARKCSARL